MKLSDFRYTAPKSVTAKFPSDPRDESQLLIIDRAAGEIEDKVFTDISDYLQKGDCLVVNESRVFPARLIGKKEKTNAQIEVMLLRELSQKDALWDVIVDPARKVRIGNKIYFDDGKLYCEVIDNTTSRGRTVRFNHTGDLFKTI
ncbi:MAG: S-adenosylmethionine:tRNA ribosyltransferase-isomerase, partial [bacterium]|nr:S-adenosylmethionine:tRNA ribosyltransferase-isomerase [Candidatus Kapabacteria bacterium]